MVEPIVLKFSLKVVSPVAILTGRELSPLEYYFSDERQELFKIDFSLLIERLKGAGRLKEFLFLLKGFRGSREELDKLHSYYREFSPFSYSLSVDPNIIGRGVLFKTIKEIVKNPLNGLPYIPGSSVKGALRTAVLEAVIDPRCFKSCSSQVAQVRRMLKPFKGPIEAWEVTKREAKKINPKVIKAARGNLSKIYNLIEKELLCQPKDAVKKLFKKPQTKRDLFRFIKVSDFLPSQPSEIEVRVGLLKRKYRDGGRVLRKFEVALEYVSKGVFEGEIRLYPRYLEKFLSCKIEVSKERIWAELERRGRNLLEKERRTFKSIYSSFNFNIPEGAVPLKIGFGGGALSKTFLDNRLRLVGNRATGFRVIPHTYPLINFKPVGWCILTLKE